jgi:hypothetical protein
MSAIQILKHGLAANLWEKKGWLFDLLVREGIIDGTKQSRKENCWSYYKSQILYIEAMQEAKDDATFDPRPQERPQDRKGRQVRVCQKRNCQTEERFNCDIPLLRLRCAVRNVQAVEKRRFRENLFLTIKAKTQLPTNHGQLKCLMQGECLYHILWMFGCTNTQLKNTTHLPSRLL